MLKRAAVLLCSIGVAVLTAQEPGGPKLKAGDAPELPALAVGGGEVLLDVAVSAAGRVTDVTTIRSMQPFTDAMIAAVRRWEFTPARDEEHRPIRSRVLVAALFRAPALYTNAGDGSAGDIARPSPDIPYPLGTVSPSYPPLAHGGGVVLVEALVGSTGAIEGTQVVRAAPPFDSAAEAAARRWLFRPAYVPPRAEARFAYIVFGFPAPVVGAVPSPRAPR